MNNINLLVTSGTTLLTLLQPLTPQVLQKFLPVNYDSSAIEAEQVESTNGTRVIEAVFGNVAATAEAKTILEKQKAFVSSRSAYSASLSVVEKHAEAIKAEAAEQGVPADVAIGVAFLENGGSETAKSSAGALGIYQLMPYTAKSLGLKVTKEVDERKNPAKSIEAGITYLASNYQRFGDWGLATWAYHAGEGNVSKAVKLYAKANDGVTLEGVKNPSQMRAYVESKGITVHELLSDPAVKEFTKKLNDDSSGYPYKVAAMSSLFHEATN